jgi:hypothetical protein
MITSFKKEKILRHDEWKIKFYLACFDLLPYDTLKVVEESRLYLIESRGILMLLSYLLPLININLCCLGTLGKYCYVIYYIK